MFKFLAWKVLVWIDNHINHAIIDELIGWYYDRNPAKAYLLWDKTFGKYCSWVNIDLFDRWHIDEYVHAVSEGNEKEHD